VHCDIVVISASTDVNTQDNANCARANRTRGRVPMGARSYVSYISNTLLDWRHGARSEGVDVGMAK
jgi:hypothetical protein